jgi:hypothetical protein
MDEYERESQEVRLPQALPHHLLMLGWNLQGGWTDSTPKDSHVQSLPFFRWNGADTPTFTPPHQPGQATCIDHLAIWDLRHLADQIGGTTTLTTSFLDLLLGDHTFSGPYKGSRHLSTGQETSGPHIQISGPGTGHGSTALQSDGGFSHRHRPSVGRGTHAARIFCQPLTITDKRTLPQAPRWWKPPFSQ